MEGDRFVLRSITDEIMYELMQLSGQEYVDTYAAKAKADLAAAKAAGKGKEPVVADTSYSSERQPSPERQAS
jgi:1-acyl-sn-glycerol-3-phosphate acyltransferase